MAASKRISIDSPRHRHLSHEFLFRSYLAPPIAEARALKVFALDLGCPKEKLFELKEISVSGAGTGN